MNEEKSFNPAELKARFNPEGSLLRRQQHRMLEVLMAFDAFCKKHNIQYWLSSGTLLGCVRHGGFIPWDDDLDIDMLREDYEKLMRIPPEEFPEQFVLQNPDTDPGYFFCYAKLRDRKSFLEENNQYDRIFKYRGIYIDIFPYEKMPFVLNWIACRAIGRCYKVLNNHKYNDEEARKKVQGIYRFCEKWLFPVLRALAKLSPIEELRFSPGIPYFKAILYDETFPLTTGLFEGFEAPIPRDSDAYLRRKFGDYMRLPDIDELHLHVGKITIED